MAILKSEKCPKCGHPEGLFVCSFGGVNCGNCGQYIRPLDQTEWEKWREAVKELEKNKPKIMEGDPELNKELQKAWTDWQIYGDRLIVPFRKAMKQCKSTGRLTRKHGKYEVLWCRYFDAQCHSGMCRASREKQIEEDE